MPQAAGYMGEVSQTQACVNQRTRSIEIAAQILRFGFVSNSFIWFGHGATL